MTSGPWYGGALRILSAFGIFAIVGGAPVAAQTLDDELAGLLSAYPLLDASRADIAAADDAIDRAFADYLPQVSLFADYGYERTDSPATRATRDSSFNTQRDTATLTITENIFDGYRTRSSNATARINRALSETELEATQQSLIFQGAAAYLNVLRHVDLIRLAIHNERTSSASSSSRTNASSAAPASRSTCCSRSRACRSPRSGASPSRAICATR